MDLWARCGFHGASADERSWNRVFKSGVSDASGFGESSVEW